jgi:hypothetical protein
MNQMLLAYGKLVSLLEEAREIIGAQHLKPPEAGLVFTGEHDRQKLRETWEAHVPRILNKKPLLKHMGESHAQLYKISGLLLAAHGGALGACVTVLKDAASKPEFMGIGVFFLLFGCGLIASIFNYGSVFFISAVVRNSLMDDEDPNDSPSVSFLKGLNVISLAVAVLTFLIAIVLIILRAAYL